MANLARTDFLTSNWIKSNFGKYKRLESSYSNLGKKAKVNFHFKVVNSTVLYSPGHL